MSTAQETPRRPTPAQLRWLKDIDRGVVVRYGHSWVNGLRGGGHQSNYIMTCALHDAGWIDGEQEQNSRYVVFLTPAGRAVLASATNRTPKDSQ